jgi:hypothetical protein
MTIPDYIAFAVLIMLFVVNVVMAVVDCKLDQTNAQNNRFVSRS